MNAENDDSALLDDDATLLDDDAALLDDRAALLRPTKMRCLDGVGVNLCLGDGLVQLFDDIFIDGKVAPIRRVAHLLLKVVLTMHGLMGFVLLVGAVGAWSGQEQLALPEQMQHLTITAGDLFGLDSRLAAILVPGAAGLGEVAAIVAFWNLGPATQSCAAGGLAIMFALVTWVHHSAGAALLPPAMFALLATLTVCVSPGRKTHSE